MPIRYDSLLARTLAREILDRWRGVRIAGLRMASGRRAVELAFDDGSRLVAMLHPLHGYVLELDPASPVSGVEGRSLRVGRLSLLDARAPADERALLLTFGDRGGRAWEMLAIELQTRRWNALHCRREEPDSEPGADSGAVWRIETALLARDAGDRPLRSGAPYEPPSSSRRAVAALPLEAEWEAALAVDEADRRRTVLQTWAWTSALNVDWILAGSDPAESYARYRSLHPLAEPPSHGPDARLLTAAAQQLAPGGGPGPALEALPAAATDDDAGDEAVQLRRRLRARRNRYERRAAALERQLAAAGPPDEPRLLGQLLLARKDEVPRGASAVSLPGFDGTPREIALDPARDVVANAENFFDEARRRARALERLPDAIAAARQRAVEFDAHLERLAESGPSDALWAAAGGKPVRSAAGGRRAGGRRAGDPEARLPYTRLRSSGGLEIRVGRGARDNDDLTFRHSAPDDIWLHASQASGAHVILRWGRKDENPPRRDLLEAAIAAAVHSGARHSGTAPVVWTRRKYVRKPRKSPRGTVAPTHVQTIFVKPDSDLVKGLARRMEET